MNKLLLSLAAKLIPSFLDGYKTYVAGVLLMLLGTGQILLAAMQAAAGMVDLSSYPALSVITPIDMDTAETAIKAGAIVFGNGLGLFGIRHALNKGGSGDVAINQG